MRRFINSKLGKVVGNGVALALIIPYVTLVTATRAVAQQVTLPSWAILDWINKTDRGPADIGAVAADAFRTELEKIQTNGTPRYDIVPRETIDRALKSLELQSPVTQKESLLRLGQEVGAASVVTGTLLNWRVVKDGAGKHAELIAKIEVLDVASGIVVNGSALYAISTVRPMETADDTLLQDGLKMGAYKAVSEITGRELPKATVLNTLGDRALINGGERTGFKEGQEVIILRGREQVGAGVVSDLQPDGAYVNIKKKWRGVQPGDKVRAIFSQPDMTPDFARGGGPVIKPARRSGANSGLLTALAVVGLIVAVIATGSSGQDVLARVKAEPTGNGPGGLAAVQVSWTPDFITKGSDRRMEFDIWRNDFGFGTLAPIRAVPGSQLSMLDTSAGAAIGSFSFSATPSPANPGGITCAVTDFAPAPNAALIPGVVSGVPYTYSVSLIYRLMGLELPTATADDWCYFSSSQTAATGTATPYNASTLTTPNDGDPIAGPITFAWNAGGSLLAPISVVEEYVVEISSVPTFSKSQTITIAKFQSHAISGTNLTAGPIDLTGVFPLATIIYWRVGVKNIDDRPGPIPDVRTGERYIFSGVRSLHR